ncbi:MAG: entericidin [Muribaculaceae bacterium]|nr:entericidin [Muribaculaceae bacterium]
MKKLVLAFAVIAAMSMVSCTGNTENAEQTQDSVTTEVVEPEATPADSTVAPADSTVAPTETAAPADSAKAE